MMDRQDIIGIANSLSNADLVELLFHVSERLHITLPPSDAMRCAKVIWIDLEGSCIDLVTDALEDYLITERQKDEAQGEAP